MGVINVLKRAAAARSSVGPLGCVIQRTELPQLGDPDRCAPRKAWRQNAGASAPPFRPFLHCCTDPPP